MGRNPENPRAGSHFASVECGRPDQWGEFIHNHPRLGDVPGKLFLGACLNLGAMEVSLGQLPPGAGVPFLHAHKQNEELYLVLSGRGEMQVDGERIALMPGSALRISPPAFRSWRNTGTEPMSYLVIQAKAGSLEQATGSDGILADHAVVW